MSVQNSRLPPSTLIKVVSRNKENWSIQQKYITIVNIYALNIRAPKHIKQILINLKGEFDSNIIIVDFNTAISIMARTRSQKIDKEEVDLNSTINQMDLTDKYRTTHPSTTE